MSRQFARVAVAAAALAATACSSPAARPLEPEVTGATRLFVVAPHPDDEAIGAAGLIRRVLSRGGAVKIALTTSGDAFAEGVEKADRIEQPTAADFRNYGKTREHETVAAMTGLGVGPDRITFLGFPDEGLCLLASKYLASKGRPYESPFTDREMPPVDEQVTRGVRYRGADLRLELAQLIADFRPTIVAMPHPEDEHPDHCATSVFAREALDAARLPGQAAPHVLYYLVHYGQWPAEIGATVGAALRPPAGFPQSEGPWSSLVLTEDETAAKKAALTRYTTQMEAIGRFLLAFARTNELYLEQKPSPPECWCDANTVATELPREKQRGRRKRAS